MNNKRYIDLIREATDLHVHVGPEIIPRRFTIETLKQAERGRIKAIGVKNHFFPTVSMGSQNTAGDSPKIIHSVTLNRYVGGLNADAIRASSELAGSPIIVWFPTLHTSQFLKSQSYEIPEEWIDPSMRDRIQLQLSSDIEPLEIFNESGDIALSVDRVLQTIKTYNAILATGHLSWEESRALVRYASEKIGIKKIIITHPIYQKIAMPIEIQKELVGFGARIEHCYSMVAIDDIPIQSIADQIKCVGALNCILSSDVGQTFSPSPSEALNRFLSGLSTCGITDADLARMTIEEPGKLVS